MKEHINALHNSKLSTETQRPRDIDEVVQLGPYLGHCISVLSPSHIEHAERKDGTVAIGRPLLLARTTWLRWHDRNSGYEARRVHHLRHGRHHLHGHERLDEAHDSTEEAHEDGQHDGGQDERAEGHDDGQQSRDLVFFLVPATGRLFFVALNENYLLGRRGHLHGRKPSAVRFPTRSSDDIPGGGMDMGQGSSHDQDGGDGYANP